MGFGGSYSDDEERGGGGDSNVNACDVIIDVTVAVGYVSLRELGRRVRFKATTSV